jgi:hypothetical protein
VLFAALPLLAQSSAQGSFSFKGTEGLQTVDFDALGDTRSAQGYFTLTGPTLVSDQLDQEDEKDTILVRDFTMKVSVDCMSSVGVRVTMSGVVSDSNVRSMIGRVASLTVEDNALDPKDPTDRFTFGSYWQKNITWFPTDSEVKDDRGWAMTWQATDEEVKGDVGYPISRTRQVDCSSFPVATYDLAPIDGGRIIVNNK